MGTRHDSRTGGAGGEIGAELAIVSSALVSSSSSSSSAATQQPADAARSSTEHIIASRQSLGRSSSSSGGGGNANNSSNSSGMHDTSCTNAANNNTQEQIPPLAASSSSSISAAKLTLLSLLPGAAQGATTVLLGHPFDTAKTRLQADTQLKLQTRSSIRVMRQMIRHEGAVSLYRGVTPPLAIMGSKRGLQFALWEQIKKRKTTPSATSGGNDVNGGGERGAAAGGGVGATTDLVGIKRSLSASVATASSVVANNNFISGAVSGAFGTLLGCPMHVIKIQTQNVSVANSEGRRWNAFYCTKAILCEDGVRGLYRGFKFHVLKDTP